MSGCSPQSGVPAQDLALGRWANEGGATRRKPKRVLRSADEPESPQMSNADIEQLRVRVIALENLVITLLAEASHGQLKMALDMATFISPRRGAVPHALTSRAGRQMAHLVRRAGPFRV